MEALGDESSKKIRLAIDTVIRERFPRAANGPARKMGRRAQRKALISADDARFRCLACGGTGSTDRAGACVCGRCGGTGLQPGQAEHDPADTHLGGSVARGGSRIRGEFAQQFGGSDFKIRPPAAHTRGHLGQVEREVDESAETEARAIKVMSDIRREQPLGKRIANKRDPSSLTPGQGKRFTTEQRTRRYQADHNKAVRKANPRAYQRSVPSAVEEALRLCGIDVKAFRAACKGAEFQIDSPEIREARRRNDLPPDDLIDARDGEPIRLDDGRRVWIDGRLECAAMVYRLKTGKVEKIVGGVRVRCEDGDVDVLHPDDVPASATAV
jgi:hypothetical protein